MSFYASSERSCTQTISQLPGCITLEEQPQPQSVTPSELPKTPQDDSVAKRFQESEQKGPSAIETAIDMAKKHAMLSEQVVELRQQNKELATQNEKHEAQIEAANAKLLRTEKELKQANDMLISMQIELNNWKSDILGFRDEMRQADNAQIKALLDIFKTLSGDIQTENEVSADKSSNEIKEQ